MPIVWTLPDESLVIEALTPSYLEHHREPNESTEAAVMRLALYLQGKKPQLAGATARLVKTAAIPADSAKRHAWRFKDGRVVVDPTIRQAVAGE